MPRPTTTKDSETWYRTDPAHGFAELPEPRVDREKGLLRGFIVMEKGLARGHGEEADDETLDRFARLSEGRKLKMRFGHPGMSDDGKPAAVGRAFNVRRDGERLLADAELLQAADGDSGGHRRKHILDLAEEAPDLFAMSVVMRRELEKRRDEKGEELRDTDGKALPPLIRPTAALAVDFVDDGALTPSLFASTNALLSAEASQQLDKILDRDDAVDRLRAFARRLTDTHPAALELFRAALEGDAMPDTLPETGKTAPEKPAALSNDQMVAQLEAAGFKVAKPAPIAPPAPATDESVLSEVRALRADLEAERTARKEAEALAAKAQRDAAAKLFADRIGKLIHLGADDRKGTLEAATALLEAGQADAAERLVAAYERLPDQLSGALDPAQISVPFEGGERTVDLSAFADFVEEAPGEFKRVLRGDPQRLARAALAEEIEDPEKRREARMKSWAASRREMGLGGGA